jgi:hypothetical protein
MKLWFEGWKVNAHDVFDVPAQATPAAFAVAISGQD